MREFTPYEQATVDADLPVLERWVAEHPRLRAEVVVDRDAYESNVGHVLLVVRLLDHSAVRLAREELAELVSRPEHLRVRAWRWMPDPAEIERLHEEVRAVRVDGPGRGRISVSWADVTTGFLVVALDREDPALAAAIEAVRPGWVRVHPEPIVVHPLA
ncbi:hypothetical protein [Kribbella sp. NPDC051770]|uniref:hypothetical protein n=1 Tax=Kribbella sp. NPDC051770 TaxID=3155413 RepID=UPI003423ECF8